MTNNNRTYVNKGTSYKGPSWEKAGLSFMQRLVKNEPSEGTCTVIDLKRAPTYKGDYINNTGLIGICFSYMYFQRLCNYCTHYKVYIKFD